MKVIGIGASAGGMQAMTELLSTLPADTGAAFVLIQHLSPDYKSIMGELLSRYTKMPVEAVRKNTSVKANTLYVMAENVNLTFEHGMLIAHERDTANPINLPIDYFFHSLGQSLKEEAVGVVLSGSGTDGSRGIRTIREHGGIILVQDPASARFNGMPMAAIQLNIAHSILSPEKLAEMLAAILSAEGQINEKRAALDGKQAEQENLFRQMLKLVKQQSGIDFFNYREPTLRRRMYNRMLLQKAGGLESYLNILAGNSKELEALCDDFLIGVTRFFRDPDYFDELKENVFPKLVERALEEERPLRFWVPACSSGEEAYSLAMSMSRYLRQHKLEVDFKIFSSDVDKKAIRFANSGLYPGGVIADIPKEILADFWIKEGNNWRISSLLREKMLFAVQDVLKDPPFIHMDLVSCRNLLIYLKSDAQYQVLSTLHFALNDSGYLLLGPSESLGELKNAFTRIVKKRNLFEKKPGSRSRFRPRTTGDIGKLHQSHSTAGSKMKDKKDLKGLPYEMETDPFTQYLVRQHAPATLFINEELDILYMNGDLNRILTLPQALARFNIYRMAGRKEARIFQNGVRNALSSGEHRLYKEVVFENGEEKVLANLRFEKVKMEDIPPKTVLVEVFYTDGQGNEETIKEFSHQDQLDEQVSNLESELSASYLHAQRLVDELEATNEELQASNRELLESNEELQSTNEELQSVNEELYTVNSELQQKNEELLMANNDMANLLKSTEIGTIFLDKELRIRRFTPAIHRQFQLLDTDIGRPITNFSSTFRDLNIGEVCQSVFDNLKAFEEEVSDEKGDHYLMRILPYRTDEHVIEGLVITFVDVRELTSAKGRITQLANKFQAIFEYSENVILVISKDYRVSQVNQAFGPYSESQLSGNDILQLFPEDQAERFKQSLEKAFRERKPAKVKLELPGPDDAAWKYEANLIPEYENSQDNGEVSSVIVIAQQH